MSAESEAGSFRVLFAAGGTGGHIFPSLAVAEALRARASRNGAGGPVPSILFLGTGRGLETRLVPTAGYPLRVVPAAGLKGIGGWRWVRNLFVLPRSAIGTASVLREFRPQVVVGVGGYLAGPAMLEAALEDIPTLLIEPNAVPGFTNRVLGPIVRIAAVGFQEAAPFYGLKARVTGHPVRKALFDIPIQQHAAPYTVLVFGGSQGSKAINECVVKALPLLATDAEPLTFIHQTGEKDYHAVEEAYQDLKINADVRAFFDDMPGAFTRANLVIARAGANTVAELCAAARPSVLIPFPAATDHHQLENARVLERAGAARVIKQTELTPVRLSDEIRKILAQPELLTQMGSRARALARPDACERIARLVEELARNT